MLDVVFLLLIFFMLTSIFAKPMLPLNLPEAKTAELAPEPEVVIAIHADGTVLLNGQETTPTELLPALSALFGGRRQKDVSLHSDRGIPFGRVVEIMDLAKQAGAEDIAVVTETPR
jgi:biopolymer transport protein ExbD